jgi:hypothetical protein
MGLKLTLQNGDKVMMSNGVIIDVLTTSNKQTSLEFHADADVKIDAVFKDSTRMFKNKRKQAVELADEVNELVDEIDESTERNFNR